MTRSILSGLVAAAMLSMLASGPASGQRSFQLLSAGPDGRSPVSQTPADNLKALIKPRGSFSPKELTIDKNVERRKR